MQVSHKPVVRNAQERAANREKRHVATYTNASQSRRSNKSKSKKEMSIAHKARKLLIQFGKQLPFVLCFLICCCYIEMLYSLATQNYLHFSDCTIINTPINFYIAGHIFEYDWLIVGVALVISFAIEACLWNRLSVLYAALQLWLKSYLDFELEPTTIYIICTINIVITSFLCYKGVKQQMK